MTFTSEVYPNAPLVEVVFETRFASDLEVECNRHEFWRKVKDDYPQIMVPMASTDKAPALQHYRFGSADRKSKVMVAINSIGYSVSEYKGYSTFSKEALKVHKVFGETFSIKKVKRFGWRYVNIIPFARDEDELIPLGEILNFGLKAPNSLPERYKTISLETQVNVDELGGLMTLRLESVLSPDGQEALLLDIDYGKESDDLVFSKVSNYMKGAHHSARQLFEDLITEEYRQYLRGEVI